MKRKEWVLSVYDDDFVSMSGSGLQNWGPSLWEFVITTPQNYFNYLIYLTQSLKIHLGEILSNWYIPILSCREVTETVVQSIKICFKLTFFFSKSHRGWRQINTNYMMPAWNPWVLPVQMHADQQPVKLVFTGVY